MADNPFYTLLASRAWWISRGEGDEHDNPRYKDIGSIPYAVMLSRGLVLLFAVLPLSLLLGFYAYRVAALAKTVHAVGIPPTRTSRPPPPPTSVSKAALRSRNISKEKDQGKTHRTWRENLPTEESILCS